MTFIQHARTRNEHVGFILGYMNVADVIHQETEDVLTTHCLM